MGASWKSAIKLGIFRMNGMKPWTFGYSVYKAGQIRLGFEAGEFDAASLKDGYGYRVDERVVEYPWFLSRLPDGPGSLLDAGSILNHDFILDHPRLKSKDIFISTLAPEAKCFWSRDISYVFEDLRSSCFRDNYFDWVASISTVEHIGLDNTMLYTSDGTKRESDRGSYLQAIREFYRVLKPGGTLFLSMPFGKRANHGWFQVFDGEMVDETLAPFEGDSVTQLYFKYEANGWKSATRDECREAEFFDIHAKKVYNDLVQAGAGAIVCLEITKSK